MLVIAAIALMGAASAHAEADKDDTAEDAAKKEEFVKRLFAREVGRDKAYACFARRYDPEHLARHPLQKVSAMKLLLTAETGPEAEAPSYSFRLGVHYRNKRGAYDSSGDCRHGTISAQTNNEARFHCYVDCDGGGIDIGLNKDYKSTLIRLESIRVWRDNKPDEEASDALVAGADDKIFRLDRTDLEECRSLVTDREELAEMRRKR
jgi:hypothetical protein